MCRDAETRWWWKQNNQWFYSALPEVWKRSVGFPCRRGNLRKTSGSTASLQFIYGSKAHTITVTRQFVANFSERTKLDLLHFGVDDGSPAKPWCWFPMMVACEGIDQTEQVFRRARLLIQSISVPRATRRFQAVKVRKFCPTEQVPTGKQPRDQQREMLQAAEAARNLFKVFASRHFPKL